MTQYLVTRTTELLVDLGDFEDELEADLSDEEHAVALAIAMNQWEVVDIEATIVPTRLRLA